MCAQVVQEYERVVIFRLGRLLTGGARGPGIFFIVPCVDSYQKVDMRTLTFDVPPQEVRSLPPAGSHPYTCHFSQPANTVDVFQILTKDSVTVHVDAIMYYKVSNAICAISNVDDYGQSTRLLAATTLRYIRQTLSDEAGPTSLCAKIISSRPSSPSFRLHFILFFISFSIPVLIQA